MKKFWKKLGCFLLLLTFCRADDLVLAATIKLSGKRISIATRPIPQTAPAAAFNPVTRQFFITWDTNVIPGEGLSEKLKGRFVNANGSVTAEKIYGSSDFINNISLAFNTDSNWFLGSWGHSTINGSGGLHSQIVNSNGNVLSNKLILSDQSLAQTISYQEKTDRFLLAGFDEFSLLLDGSGRLLKKINYPRGAFFRHVALADTATSDFFIVAQRANSLRIVVFRFSSDGILKGSTSILSPTPLLQGAAINSSSNEMLLLLGTFEDLFAYRLNRSFKILSQANVAKYRSGDLLSSAVIFAQGKYWISYSRDKKLYVKLLGALGKPISKETFVDMIKDFSFRKILVADQTANRVLLVWQTSITDDMSGQIWHIYARFLSSQ